MITIIEALGTSTPTSITVVATRTSISPPANALIVSSFNSELCRPCNGASFKPLRAPVANFGASSSTLVIFSVPANSSLVISSPIIFAIAISAAEIFALTKSSPPSDIRGATM